MSHVCLDCILKAHRGEKHDVLNSDQSEQRKLKILD
jgi:hypothetical protein